MKNGLCDEKEQAKCLEEMGEEHLDWACERCEKKKAEDLHEYTAKLLRLRMLKKAGYPFKINDLTLEEWYDLGRVEQCLETPDLSKLK